MLNHFEKSILLDGEEPIKAEHAVILFHGKGSDAENIMSLTDRFPFKSVAYIAPNADMNMWFQHPLYAPRENNLIALETGFKMIDEIILDLEAEGIAKTHISLIGFSQGGVLALEYLYQNPEPFHSVFALSSGLLGEHGTLYNMKNSLKGTHVFLGSSDQDFFVQKDRLRETHHAFEKAGANTTLKIYENMNHTICDDEIDHMIEIISTAL